MYSNILFAHMSSGEKRLFLPQAIRDTKVHGANMGPTSVLVAPDGPHVGPMNPAIRDG